MTTPGFKKSGKVGRRHRPRWQGLSRQSSWLLIPLRYHFLRSELRQLGCRRACSEGRTFPAPTTHCQSEQHGCQAQVIPTLSNTICPWNALASTLLSAYVLRTATAAHMSSAMRTQCSQPLSPPDCKGHSSTSSPQACKGHALRLVLEPVIGTARSSERTQSSGLEGGNRVAIRL
jgi:hypothetical protein